jgi:aminoglycoside 3-N-acetyltransferase
LTEYNNFSKTFKKLGLKKGDMVYVASDIVGLIIFFKKKKKSFNLELFINSLLEVVGEKGTLLFPTFNWGFCNGETFDIKNTLSKCGSLTNYVLKRKDFLRTKHPIYSFAVYGKYQKFFCNLNNKKAWDIKSPFHYIYKKKAKNIFIGLDYKKAFTMDHYFEQICKVKYRYEKVFTSKYINYNRKVQSKKYSMLVRNKSLCDVTVINPKLDKILKKDNAYKKVKLYNTNFSIIDIFKTGKILKEDLNKKQKLIYPVKY